MTSRLSQTNFYGGVHSEISHHVKSLRGTEENKELQDLCTFLSSEISTLTRRFNRSEACRLNTHLQVALQHSQSRQRCFLPAAGEQRGASASPKGAKELTVFAVIAWAAHSVTHAAFSALPAGQADLRTGAPAAGGTRAVLISAALLILCAWIRLREGGRERMRHLGTQVPTFLDLDARHSPSLPTCLKVIAAHCSQMQFPNFP